MPRSKSRAIVRSFVRLGFSRCPMPRRPDAGGGELVVEPGRRPAAEIGADRLMNRRQHLQHYEDDADERQRSRQITAAELDPADQPAHGDREHCRQQPAHDENDPPGDRQALVGTGRIAANFHSLRARKLSITGCVLPILLAREGLL